MSPEVCLVLALQTALVLLVLFVLFRRPSVVVSPPNVFVKAPKMEPPVTNFHLEQYFEAGEETRLIIPGGDDEIEEIPPEEFPDEWWSDPEDPTSNA